MLILLRDGHDDALADRMINQRCHVYRTHFALDAFRDPGCGDIRVRTGPSTAGLIAPRALAATAAALLVPVAVPAFSVSRDMCVFVTEGLSGGLDVRRLSIALFRCAVVLILAPSPLAVPTPGNPRRCWLSVPHGPTRPPIDVVAAALLRAAKK